MDILGRRPLIALAVKDENIESTLKNAKNYKVDLIELRVDQLTDTSIEHIKKISGMIKNMGFLLLFTVRSVEEGGVKFIDDKDRLNIFRELAYICDILDIEFTSTSIRDDVVKLAKDNGKLVLMSYHDFEKTPENDFIQSLIDRSKDLGADIVKYAFKINSNKDLADILCITHKNRDKNIVAIGMGENGKISRVAGFIFGSLITYTYIGQSFAPGQIEVGELIDQLKFYGLI